MNRKIKILYDKIFEDFAKGKYGIPRIPTQKEVLHRLKTMTEDDYSALTNNLRLDDIDIQEIHDNFSRVVDDIDILYQSIEDESRDVLDQLTNSLKEHNGVKRELRYISERAKDIQSGKLGKDYLKYVHTETFNSLDNINIAKTTTDAETQAPVVDIKAGSMYIPNSTANLVDLSHYNRKKIDIVNTDYIGTVSSAGYIGHSDAGAILNPNDSRRLVYRVKTNTPTAMKSSFVIKLTQDGTPLDINAVVLNIDAGNTKGSIRLFYRTDEGWRDVPGLGVKSLKYDRNLFRFNPVKTSHLKFQVIKDAPDILDSSEYFIVIHDLAIVHAYTHKTSTLYSKSIQMTPYSTESPVIGRISAATDAVVPDGCKVNVYVAKDKLIRAYFVDANGDWVDPESVNVDHIVDDSTSLYPSRHILLSQVKQHPDLSGIAEEYGEVDFDWIKIKTLDEYDDNTPEILEFNGTISKNPFNNSLYQGLDYIKFGDSRYSGTYPQTAHPESPDDWFLSGVVNTSNPYWAYMQPLVESGLIASGADFGDPTGYPLNYYNSTQERTWLFGDHLNAINGWYRPSSESVTPTGVTYVEDFDPYPDFYVNGNRYYRIYKFHSVSVPIESTIKIHTYETRPVEDENNSYPHNFIWNYRTRQVTKSATFLDYAYPIENYPDDSFSNSSSDPASTGVVYLPLTSEQTYIPGSVRDISYENHNNLLTNGTDYIVKNSSSSPYVDFGLQSEVSQKLNDERYIITYSYSTEEKYTSFWESYILVDLDSYIAISQRTVNDEPLVKRILLSNVDTGDTTEYDMVEDQLRIELSKGTYNIKIFCLSDPSTKFCADPEWTPYLDEDVVKGSNVRCVANIEPLRIVDFNLLLFSTPYERDNRAALIDDADGYTYLVVKEPSKRIIRGYRFDESQRSYVKDDTTLIPNTGHYKRNHINEDTNTVEEYITGSQGSDIVTHDFDSTLTGIFSAGNVEIDTTWNQGRIWPPDFQNTDPTKLYTLHSTYGNKITLDDRGLGDYNVNNAGHLFYNTGENLPAFYTIEYGSVDVQDPTKDRFLYRIDLLSEHEVNTPIVNSVKFVINGDLEDEA